MRITLLSLLFLGLFYTGFSQDTIEKRKISTGWSAEIMSCQYTNGRNKVSYENLNSNTAGGCTFDINFPFKKKLEIKTGVGYNYKYGDANITGLNDVRVYEQFARIPLILNILSSNSNEKSDIRFYSGIGPYIDILASQKFYFKDPTTIPTNFKESCGFGSYLKSGITMNFGLRFNINKMKGFIDFGIKGDFDYDKLFINPKDNPIYVYSSLGICFSLVVF
jgi:hypothetical protein